ncbi:MAG: ABC transporter permease subunit [Acidimicrobiia bacterium]
MTTETVGSRPVWWRDVGTLRIVAQVVAVAAAFAFLGYLYRNLVTNLRAQGIGTGFEFLARPAGVNVAGSGFEASQPVRSVILLGVKNTLALVIVGVPVLTVVGVVVGIARLSSNWLVRKAASVYVETLRNIPPLLVILIAFNAVLLPLPTIDNALHPLGVLVVSNRELGVPWLVPREGSGLYLLVLTVALVLAAGIWVWRTRRFDSTGAPHHRVLWSSAFLVGVGIGAYFLIGTPFQVSLPEVRDRIVVGGMAARASYVAVLVALAMYTASHVAEITRGSILAVPKGQTEAANALALTRFQRLRFVVLPQAFRIAIPPMINQFLNFTKNTSLGIAVGYAEVTLVTFQAIGNGYPAPQMILILMGVYLVFSLTISALVNILNRRLQFVTR